MNLLRSLLAVFFAIAVANPACCCTARTDTGPAETSSCCGGTEKEKAPGDHSCACEAKQPKQLEDPPQVPAFVAVELPAPAAHLPVPAAPAAPAAEKIRPGYRNDTGPPRLRLALLQRFLI